MGLGLEGLEKAPLYSSLVLRHLGLFIRRAGRCLQDPINFNFAVRLIVHRVNQGTRSG